MKAARKFTGYVDGKRKTFLPGDKITKTEAEELGLSQKPELVYQDKPKPTE